MCQFDGLRIFNQLILSFKHLFFLHELAILRQNEDKLGLVNIRVLHHNLRPKLVQSLILFRQNIFCLQKITLCKLIILQDLLHSWKAVSFCDINVKNDRINANHLLIQTQSCFTNLYCAIFQTPDHCSK